MIWMTDLSQLLHDKDDRCSLIFKAPTKLKSATLNFLQKIGPHKLTFRIEKLDSKLCRFR